MTANQKLDQSTALLEESRRIIATTENIGVDIITNMDMQKEQLVKSQQNVKETKGFTDDAKKVLRTMGNRAVIHKICVMFTILVLLGAIIAIGYYGFVAKKK